jgi:hypothetical protein
MEQLAVLLALLGAGSALITMGANPRRIPIRVSRRKTLRREP